MNQQQRIENHRSFAKEKATTTTATMKSLRRHPSQCPRIAISIALLLLLLLLVISNRSLQIEAWVRQAPSSSGLKNSLPPLAAKRSRNTALFYSSEFSHNSNTTNSHPQTASSSVVERLKVNGVSVSPKGFHVLLESTTRGEGIKIGPDDSPRVLLNKNNGNSRSVLPLKMTNDPADAFAATSPESLTLCQLLGGVDMAGAILPPELLGRILACHIEDKLDSLYEYDGLGLEDNGEDLPESENNPTVFTPVISATESKIWEYIQNQQALMRERKLWQKQPSSCFAFRVQMPQVTLDQLTLVSPSTSGDSGWQCKLECALPEWKETVAIDVRSDLLASLAYNYDPESSPLFTSIALALRYKAPIVLEQPPNQPSKKQQPPRSQEQQMHYYWSSRDELERDFPQRKTLESLQKQSTRVTQNIEQGFEIHRLTGALQIAMRLGDAKAADKIHAKLDEYDSMADLPTLKNNNDPSDDDDDLENNIFQ